MSTDIHPTAVIGKNASIGEDVEIGPFCVIGSEVAIGDGCRIMQNSSIINKTTLGSNNTIYPGSVIGAEPQDLKYTGEDSRVIIGNNNNIRECVTVNLGTSGGGGKTVIGDDNLIMAYCHIAHDCILQNKIVLANLVQLAGHIVIEDGAILSGVAAVHHFTTIGRLSFIGGHSAVRKDVPPFVLFEGNPAKEHGLNLIGLKRNGVSGESLKSLKKAYRIFYRSELNRNQAIEKVKDEGLESVAEVAELVKSFVNSANGRQGRALEASRSTDIFTASPNKNQQTAAAE
ncbi:MAG: acyl-ACP--UDP-N-acetylglucosamine O-acyltransferase [Planctomycetota bacterium]|jgi:UDP-N-acetylglucosamine acyltransferase